jgi:hypothetical protein
MGRSALFLVVLATVVAVMSGCGLVRHQFRDDARYQAAVTEINIDTGSGSVTVRPGEDGSVLVKRHVWYVAAKPGQTSRVDGSVLHLGGCGRNCSVDYDITAPPGARITGGTGSGNIDVANVSAVSVRVGSGDVKVHHVSGSVSAETGSGNLEVGDVQGSVAARTGSGDVKLTDLTGNLVAETSSGNLDGSGLRGRAVARTTSGDVTLRLAEAEDVTAKTDSGELRLTVPAGARFRIEATTGSGDKHLDVPNDTGADHHLDLRTGSGDVTVRAA